MRVNKATLDLIKEFEGLRLEAYKCPAGVWTIGYGTTARAGVGIKPEAGMVITEAEAEWYLEQSVAKFAAGVDAVITAPINENERGALVSLAYNIGLTGFRKSSALRWLNSGDKAKAAAAIKLWNKAGNKVLAGLVRRREAEVALFWTPVPAVQAEAPQGRTSAAQSRTVQASVAQAAAGVGGALASLQSLDGTAQIIAMVGCVLVVLLGVFIVRERLKAWAAGWR
jgi:lysozyme